MTTNDRLRIMYFDQNRGEWIVDTLEKDREREGLSDFAPKDKPVEPAPAAN